MDRLASRACAAASASLALALAWLVVILAAVADAAASAVMFMVLLRVTTVGNLSFVSMVTKPVWPVNTAIGIAIAIGGGGAPQ